MYHEHKVDKPVQAHSTEFELRLENTINEANLQTTGAAVIIKMAVCNCDLSIST